MDLRGTWTESDWYQPEYWQVSLDLVFPDSPALADLEQFNHEAEARALPSA